MSVSLKADVYNYADLWTVFTALCFVFIIYLSNDFINGVKN